MLTKRRRQRKQQKKSHLCTCRTLFFVHFFAVVLHDDNVKLPETFFAADHFYLGSRWYFSFSHSRYKIFMLFFKQNWSSLFFISGSSSFSVIYGNAERENAVLYQQHSPTNQQAVGSSGAEGC